jgi:sucrose phosphorylase
VNSAHTHRIVQTIRTIFDLVAPKVAVITETNVPHKDNIAYFGNGSNEAQMVYNFALPMLTLNAFHTGSVQVLSEWAATLEAPSDHATFFNFLACHDGIGLMPVTNILSPDDIHQELDRTRRLGGFVSYKNNEDGSQSPYELNINYLDALQDPHAPETELEMVANRFLATQSIMLALQGVPGIYFHSLFGSQNWIEGVQETGRYRTINRQKLDRDTLEAELADSQTLRSQIFHGFRHMLTIRQTIAAFHPAGKQEIFNLGPLVFAVLRSANQEKDQVLCLTNITEQAVNIQIPAGILSISLGTVLQDMLTETKYPCTESGTEISLKPYQIVWLQAS